MYKQLLLLTTILSLSFTSINAQNNSTKIHFAYESEIMCFINSGYHFSGMVGKKGIRARLVLAQATYPDAFNPEGFTGLTSTFYEMEFDFYLGKKRNEFRGLWFASGPGYTKQTIELKETGETGSINLFDIHAGIGYAIGIFKGFYINPWIGVDFHMNAKDVPIGNQTWTPNFIDPVLGMKLGYSF